MSERAQYSPNTQAESPSGRNVALGDKPSFEGPLKLERAEIMPGHIEVGGTEIVLQRHGKYVSDTRDEKAGGLTDEAREIETKAAAEYFTDLLDELSDEEVANTHFLFVSSDTAYAGKGKRSYETATVAQQVARVLLEERGVAKENILNIANPLNEQGSPRSMAQLREPQMFDESPDFVKFLQDKYGDGKDFWIAFEEDWERDSRQGMGAEGPDDIADRMKNATRVLSRYASLFHDSHPDSRLVIWAGTHYDTISPYVKRDVLHKGKEEVLLVDYGGGITIDIDKDNKAVANIHGLQYSVDL